VEGGGGLGWVLLFPAVRFGVVGWEVAVLCSFRYLVGLGLLACWFEVGAIGWVGVGWQLRPALEGGGSSVLVVALLNYYAAFLMLC